MSLFLSSSRSVANVTFRRALASTATNASLLRPQKQQQQGRNYSDSTNFAGPLSRQEAQDLLDRNPIFREAVNQFRTYRDIAEGELGGPTVDVVDKAIQLDYTIRWKARLFEQAARSEDCCEY